MSQVFKDDWCSVDPLQDDFNFGTASGVTAFSNALSDYPLDSNPYQAQDSYQEPSIGNFSNGAVASNAFVSSSAIPNYRQQDSVDFTDRIPQSAVGVDAFGNSSFNSQQSQTDSFDCANDSFIAEYSESDSSPANLFFDDAIDNSFDRDSSGEQVSFNGEACQRTIPHSGEEEFEIEIEEPEIENIQDVPKKKQKGFQRMVGEAVESGVATAATGILSAYMSPVAATAVVNTGIAAGKKVCFGIANRRVQKKTADSHYSSALVSELVPSDGVTGQSSEAKSQWKETGKEIGREVGKELTRQICFGIEKRRKQKANGSASMNKVSKHSDAFTDSSLDYEPGSSGFGVKDLLNEIDVAKIVNVASSCLQKKIPTR